ncbi:Solute carrier family 32 [Heracleum sosnowskyi]|uniref:Solute carrier family 32 n=1 Tax=Heracleum sosnowskyi TaxID=360622 RepID=A0AAD8H4L1_9APIA|nr:Solute carrier family 32 [Heracleum sosnowskyi]
MEAKSKDTHSLTIGLLLNNKIIENDVVSVSVADETASTGNTFMSQSTGGTTSFFKTAFNGLNALSGVGILSIPYALASGGWLSLIFLFIIATVTFYTALLIQSCMDADSNIRTYPDIGERAFGRKGMGFEINGFRIGANQSFILIVALIILPTMLVNNMGVLSYISATGVVASFVILGSIFWTGAFEGIGFHEKGELLNWKGIPTAASLYVFSYCAHPIFPTLYISLGNKKNFSKVMFLSFLLCTIPYALIAVFGYLMFGSMLKSQITLNLPINKVSSKVAIYTTLVNPIAKYALILTPVIHTIENRFRSYCKKRSFSVFIRTALLISSVAVAMTVPFFGLLMSLVGAFLSVAGGHCVISHCC